jgi:DNA invertase Pin-like site-specific DNA recombinase
LSNLFLQKRFDKYAECAHDRSVKGFAYLRVSGRARIEGDGFTRQLQTIKRYAAAHDIKITRVFRENSISGAKDLENRPALIELMTALHSNGVRVVLIEKLDRLARDPMVQETIIADLRKNGFDLISAMEPDLMQDDPGRKAFRQMMGVFAEYEKSMIVMKLRGARIRMKAKTGRCEGAKPYGTFPGEAEIIERMTAMHTAGAGFDKIAAALNAESIKPRRGARWYGSTVSRILRHHLAPVTRPA